MPAVVASTGNWATAARESLLSWLVRLLSTSRIAPVCMSFNKKATVLIAHSVPVKGMEGKKIVQIAAGNQHGLALTDAG
jgi:hypothetical protein